MLIFLYGFYAIILAEKEAVLAFGCAWAGTPGAGGAPPRTQMLRHLLFRSKLWHKNHIKRLTYDM